MSPKTRVKEGERQMYGKRDIGAGTDFTYIQQMFQKCVQYMHDARNYGRCSVMKVRRLAFRSSMLGAAPARSDNRSSTYHWQKRQTLPEIDSRKTPLA